MAARTNWDFDNGGGMHVVEIRGDAYTENVVTRTLDEEYDRFGSVPSILYTRYNSTVPQQRLVETLGIEWDTRDMPWLLVLETEPEAVEEGERAILFRLGDLNERSEVRDVTNAIIEASREEDFIADLTWEKRKQRFLELLPALKESANLAIAIVGL